MSEIPTIREFMTPNPHTIDGERPASAAARLMDDLDIRHLPVMRGPRVMGVVSERDLIMAESLQQQADIIVKVSDLCTLDAFSVAPDTPLDEVLERMVDLRIGSAVVMDGGTVVGVFTTMDACRSYKDLLRSQALRSAR